MPHLNPNNPLDGHRRGPTGQWETEVDGQWFLETDPATRAALLAAETQGNQPAAGGDAGVDVAAFLAALRGGRFQLRELGDGRTVIFDADTGTITKDITPLGPKIPGTPQTWRDPETGILIRLPDDVLQGTRPLAEQDILYIPPPTAEDTAATSAGNEIAVTGGRVVGIGGDRYQFVPDPNSPTAFTPETIPLPQQDGVLVQIASQQYQFVRNVRPGEGEPSFEPGFLTSGVNPLFQQRSGEIGQLQTPSIDDIIAQALIDGEYEKAFAFQDFRDRPTATEAFQTALAFARSPADQVVVSAIARGQTPVDAPPPGTIRRIGPQPDFLIEAFNDFQRRTTAGRAPTDAEATTLLDRFNPGATPETDQQQRSLTCDCGR